MKNEEKYDKKLKNRYTAEIAVPPILLNIIISIIFKQPSNNICLSDLYIYVFV